MGRTEKKGGFLRRLSFASSARPVVEPASEGDSQTAAKEILPSVPRVVQVSPQRLNSVRKDVGGPRYDFLPVGAAPSVVQVPLTARPAGTVPAANEQAPSQYRFAQKSSHGSQWDVQTPSRQPAYIETAFTQRAVQQEPGGRWVGTSRTNDGAIEGRFEQRRSTGRGIDVDHQLASNGAPSHLPANGQHHKLHGQRVASGKSTPASMFPAAHINAAPLPAPKVHPSDTTASLPQRTSSRDSAADPHRTPPTLPAPRPSALRSGIPSVPPVSRVPGHAHQPLDNQTDSHSPPQQPTRQPHLVSSRRSASNTQRSTALSPPASYGPVESEASAYAKSIARNLVSPAHSPNSRGSARSGQQVESEASRSSRSASEASPTSRRRLSRPLPRPPSTSAAHPSDPAAQTPPTASSIEAGPSLGRMQPLVSTVSHSRRHSGAPGASLGQPPVDGTLNGTAPAAPEFASTDATVAPPTPIFIDFPRSPTLPPLTDPRTAKGGHRPNAAHPIERWAAEIGSLSPGSDALQAVPPAGTPSLAAASAATLSAPSLSPVATPTVAHRKEEPLHTFRSPPTLLNLLSLPRVQSSVLANLTINGFLSLTGSSDRMRHAFSGETVGRWVLQEWNIQLESEKGRSWPNLTVWEGFLESLLHDPATYSTYPPQWHNLLQHLSLSHTLIVLHLRSLPANLFPNPAPLPFEDDLGSAVYMPISGSQISLASARPRSHRGSAIESDTDSVVGPTGKMPKQERVVELVMPTPLAGINVEAEQGLSPMTPTSGRKLRHRGSMGSVVSASVVSFGRKRTDSIISASDASITSGIQPIVQGRAAPPPVSYPTAKRYGFRRPGESNSGRPRLSSSSGRPGSVYSAQSSPALSARPRMGSTHSAVMLPFPIMPNAHATSSASASKHTSLAGSETGHSSRRSDIGRHSPITGAPWNSTAFRRDLVSGVSRVEPIFDRPPPFVLGRAPILRVFVPLSARVSQWPSAEAARAAVKELDKCGATRRLRLGDLVINTAIRHPKTTEHVLLFVPFIKHLLVPLEYRYCPTGHLPAYVDGFAIAPSYYYPFLPPPQIVYLNLAPFSARAMRSVRLALDRRDVTVASGQKIAAKRYLHVAGFEITTEDRVAPEWRGVVSLETEGTAEGKAALERRLGHGDPARCAMSPWEIIREKSMGGSVWLRIVKEQ